MGPCSINYHNPGRRRVLSGSVQYSPPWFVSALLEENEHVVQKGFRGQSSEVRVAGEGSKCHVHVFLHDDVISAHDGPGTETGRRVNGV